MRLVHVAALAGAMAVASAAQAADAVRLHAAGSLRDALTEVAKAFETSTGVSVESKFGPSGLLKDEIAAGAKAEVFASANMTHPRALEAAKRAGAVRMFARNRLCALARPGLAVGTGDLLARMGDPAVKLGVSTPNADPAGDYALEVFRKAEAVLPGAEAALAAKALPLTGGPTSAAAPAGRNIYGWVVAEGRADLFLTYCTNALVAARQNPGQRVVALPDALAVGADYGLTVVTGASHDAARFADFILSAGGQTILARHGFAAPAP